MIHLKMKNKKIYLVTSGEYSDYGVDAVFTTRKKAQDYIDSLGDDSNSYYDIELYDLDPQSLMQREGVRIYGVKFNVATGFVYHVWVIDEKYVDLKYLKLNEPWKLQQDHGLGYGVKVKAKDKDHAIKIVGDIRRELKLKLGYEK